MILPLIKEKNIWFQPIGKDIFITSAFSVFLLKYPCSINRIYILNAVLVILKEYNLEIIVDVYDIFDTKMHPVMNLATDGIKIPSVS